ncbi:hypothetical protein GCM10010442_34880 [Kitasatospora kifunensis]
MDSSSGFEIACQKTIQGIAREPVRMCKARSARPPIDQHRSANRSIPATVVSAGRLVRRATTLEQYTRRDTQQGVCA